TAAWAWPVSKWVNASPSQLINSNPCIGHNLFSIWGDGSPPIDVPPLFSGIIVPKIDPGAGWLVRDVWIDYSGAVGLDICTTGLYGKVHGKLSAKGQGEGRSINRNRGDADLSD